MPDKDTRPICCLCGQRIDWENPMAKYGTKRAHWSCNDVAPPESRLPPAPPEQQT
jgi:hypothetical protein